MAHDVQNIVDDLKRDAHVKAVAVGRFNQSGICAREISSDLGPGLEQGCGFPSDNFDIVVDGYGFVAVENPLKDLPLGQQRAGVGSPLDHRLVEFSRALERLDEKKISGYQRRSEAEFLKN